MDSDINAFLEHLKEHKGYSENTIAAYRNDLTQLAAFVATEKAKGLMRNYNDILKGYLLKLKERKYSAATMARKIASAKSFFKFMVDSERLPQNPTQNLPSPQVKRRSLQFLSPSEYQSLLAEPAKLSTPEAKRDVVILELLYSTGLRISELVSLNVNNIDLERNCIRVNSRREVPFDHHLGELLRKFLTKDRVDLLYDENEPALFLNRRGQRLTRQGLWQIIKNYASRAGLGDKVTPRILRHSFARHKLQSGIDLQQLQQFLGHAYISSTKVYTKSMTGQG